MSASYRFTVYGRVQGVFFRQSTADTARELGLDGWVRNCTDGSVEGCASGDGAALERLREWLQHGPPAAKVARLEWQPCEDQIDVGFTIKH